MGRFYDTSTDVLVRHDAIVDKFVGDEIIGIFLPAMAGPRHARRAVAAAVELLQRTGHGGTGEPWVPVGAGINTGLAYVGAIGEGPDTELTAMGDTVNTTARLASAAGAGELLVTDSAADNAEMGGMVAERRVLSLKGKAEPIEVLVFGASTPLSPNLLARMTTCSGAASASLTHSNRLTWAAIEPEAGARSSEAFQPLPAKRQVSRYAGWAALSPRRAAARGRRG